MRFLLPCLWLGLSCLLPAAEPMHVTYLWHMHQPVYYPYERVQDTDTCCGVAAGYYRVNTHP
jgi:hypothetical protein